jgi:hypothetical protein
VIVKTKTKGYDGRQGGDRMTPRGGYRASNPGGRPAKPESERGKMTSFRLPPEVIEAIKAKAALAKVSQAKLIALAVDAYDPLEHARPSPVPDVE